MSSVCQQCALRLQRASQTTTRHLSNRSFSSTTPVSSALPAFVPTRNSEFDGIIEDLRLKHFFPASLKQNARKVLYQQKNRQLLEDNPRIVEFGGKQTQYQYIERHTEVPNRGDLLRKAVDIIADGGEKEWANLPVLLQAFHKIVQKPVEDKHIEKLIRKAGVHNKLASFIKCLHMVDRTGLSLKNDTVLEALLLAIRRRASTGGFQRIATTAALKYGTEVADLLETEEHGTARVLGANDPRTRPQVIGLFLELVAANVQSTGGKDVDGVVKSYAQKLLGRIKEQPASIETSKIQLQPAGQQTQFLFAVSLWHGLQLASKILGPQMPYADVARATLKQYRSVLDKLEKELEARQPQPNTYDRMAIDDWKLVKQPSKAA